MQVGRRWTRRQWKNNAANIPLRCKELSFNDVMQIWGILDPPPSPLSQKSLFPEPPLPPLSSNITFWLTPTLPLRDA